MPDRRCGAPAALALMLLTCGCTLEPRYERPTLPVPAAFPQGAPYADASSLAAPPEALAWRDFVTDPKLQAVIAQALDNNRNLRIAILNIVEARAQYQAQRADLFPHINATASVDYSNTGLAGAGAPGGGFGTSTVYSTGGAISAYELDLWGRVRSLSHQALEQYLASEAAQRASRISLISEVATSYLTLGADRQRLRIAARTRESDEETLRITQARFDAGIGSETDLRLAEAAADQARADVATFSTQAAQDLDALNLLVGATVDPQLLPTGQGDVPPTLSDVPVGLSSSVLVDRPDVQQAEHLLRGFNANIGAARAAFFPTITLTGSGGTTGVKLSQLFAPGSGSWAFSPSITMPIFEAGLNAANLKFAKAERDVAVAQYELSIQTAFREVADALAQRGTATELVGAQEAQVSAATSAERLAEARFEGGEAAYLDALVAQRTAYAAEQSLVSARLTRSTNLVTLYRVLGGGVS